MTLPDNALYDSQSHPEAFLKKRPRFAWQDATPDQLRILLVTWLSWILGAMDTMIYSLVLTPALQDLLQTAAEPPVTQAQIGWYGGLIFSIFLVGWAIGGVFLGAVADEIGRAKILLAAV
ncbi:MAG: MFS transporter, partial [Nitrospiraceae bacterium]